MKVGSAYYVTTHERVWMSVDDAKSWRGKALPAARITGDEEAIWAVTQRGEVYQGSPGTVDLVLKAQLPGVEIILGVAAEGAGWTSAGFSVDRDGKVRGMKGI